MSMDFTTICILRDGGLTTLELHRPDVLNAINQRMLGELEQAFDAAESDESVRVIAITGAGRAFSAGRDLKEIGKQGHRSGAELWARMEASSKPVVAAVNGLCYTGALSMVTCCDLVIASEDATFADTHAKYGMNHGGGNSQRLRDVIGVRAAKRMLYTCQAIDAHEALRLGLVDWVVPREELLQELASLARLIMANRADAIATTKYLLNEGITWGTAVGMALERREYLRQRREGMVELSSSIEARVDSEAEADV